MLHSMTRSGLEHTVFLNTLSSQCLCTTWRLDPKTSALLPGFCIAVHLLSVLKKHGCFKASPDCCHEHPNFVQPLCQTTCLSASSTCLHTYVHTHCRAFQVDHVWSCLILLIFSSPQACILKMHNHVYADDASCLLVCVGVLKTCNHSCLLCFEAVVMRVCLCSWTIL